MYVSLVFEKLVLGLQLTRELVPAMRKGSHKTIVNLSSAAASMTLHSKEAEKARPAEWTKGHLGYKASKAALNLQTAVLANALKHEGFVVVSMHPGDPMSVCCDQIAQTLCCTK